MSGIEFPSVVRDSAEGVLPRHPHRQIAELLAAAIVRLRVKNRPATVAESEVGLGFIGHQRVNTNPSDTQGVRN